MRLTCLLIGQDNLLIQCGKFLLEKSHQIKWVVSPVQSIQAWCEEHKIPWVNSLSELPTDKESSVDYIFSIVNGKILTKNDLKIARFAAINYHDSLLPKYAGVNATTWSILNGESTHGITWHLINEGIDEGDIVYQGKFLLAANETALTLNLRCFEEAVKGFTEIINKIESSSLTPEKQQREDRSYYGINQVLPNMGFIDWDSVDANSILRTHRALNFGNYSNNVGLLKVYLNDSFLTVLEVELSAQPSKTQQGGLVLAIEKDGLLISTTSQPILIKKLMTLDGKILAATELTKIFGLNVNSQLPKFEESFLQNNTTLYKKALSHEKYWLSQLTNITEHSFFSDRMFDQINDHIKLPSVDLKKFSINSPQKSKVYLLATVLIYLYRLNNYENFTVFWRNSTPQCANLFSNLLPISANEFQSNFKVHQIIELINQKLELLNKQGIYLSDIFLRQPSLAAIANDAKEYIITIGLHSDLDLAKNSLIHFEINQNELTIYHRINGNYQGGALAPVIENMSTHLNNILRVLLTEPDTLIHQFSFLSEEEQTKLLTWSVGEYLPLPSNTITDLFEQQVRYSPTSPVLYEVDGGVLTYHQLWVQAERMRAFIQTLNLAPQSLIAIALPTGAAMLAVMLGVLKAGCIAVPMDTNKISEIRDALNLSLVFSTTSYFDEFSKKLSTPIYDAEELLRTQSLCQNLTATQPNLSLAKQNCLLLSAEHQGAEVETLNQKQLINYAYWLANTTNLDRQSVLNISSTLPFELMITSVVSSLLAGSALTFGDAALSINPEYYLRHLGQHKISHLRITVKEWESLLAYPDEIRQLSDLKHVVLTDAVSHSDQILKWLALNTECRFLVICSLLDKSLNTTRSWVEEPQKLIRGSKRTALVL